MRDPIDRSDPLWYKDAVVYQLHVKAYFDANDDGIGDFAGLAQKLDYIQELGVTAIWLLPFYPSPLRDDGYDIADYREVNPSYGRLRDLRLLIREAHKRGLRVITELVINHTSDQHPWFQRARRAKPGSVYRDFYVWSDSDQNYSGTRIIFLDTESSNWAWDPEAQQYYWHRFYSHQPDLNFENPRVLREVMRVLHYWLEAGVDGLRLDAVPYLCEREGTNNENLPETHEILRKIRAEVDAHYPDRMLLAEANQWPEDTSEYFGKGDECHMAFHFPLMPRMYMAIAQEDRHPITDIMRQTPEIPENCQWAVFLRNHDELTLEMVTDRERDYLWNTYASDRRMRINLGIRRRLAPLMERDRRKIELMNALLFSMPGTPIVYYGDEIGMGDNFYLGDRDGVRTPMQWSPDRNGGFSRADPAKLYLPPIMDPLYGYEAVNVEAQARDPSSLLNWMRRIIAVRQGHQAFGRGSLRFLYPGNRKVLAYLREYEDETILCVANLSRSAQAVELDLAEFKARIPVELMGRSAFPPIGDLPYLLTISAYGFYWFILAREAQIPHWHEEIPDPLPELETLVFKEGWNALQAGREAEAMHRRVLPAFLAKQRWFAGKDVGIAEARLEVFGALQGKTQDHALAEAQVRLKDGAEQRYFMPLSIEWDEGTIALNSPLLPFTLAKARRASQVGALHDAMASGNFVLDAVEAMQEGRDIEGPQNSLRFRATKRMAEVPRPETPEVRRLSAEQSNTSVRLGDWAILKIYRRLIPGIHPELEIGRFLTEVADFQNTPPLLGSLEKLDESGEPTALAVLQGFVLNQGDGWHHATSYLERTLEEQLLAAPQEQVTPAAVEERHAGFMEMAAALGRRTAELHQALATPSDDPAFAAERASASDAQKWRRAARAQAEAAFKALGRASKALDSGDKALIDTLKERRQECLAKIDGLCAKPFDAVKIRVHGDYHLGQVLVTKNDYMILDFEGEPARSIEERRAKTSPFKDVAGMLRSYDYAAWTGFELAADRLADRQEQVREAAMAWRNAAQATFLAAYRETLAKDERLGAGRDDERLLALFSLEKALYEIAYEAANRPRLLPVPVRGVLGLLDRKTSVLERSL